MKRKLIALAIAGTLGLGALAAVEAQEHGGGRGHGGPGHEGRWGNPLEHLTKDLDLTTG